MAPTAAAAAEETGRRGITTWLDTKGRAFAESPLNPLASAALTLTLIPPARQRPTLYPRPAQLVLFAGVFSLSGFMAYEGHSVDAAGTEAAWASLYLLINGWKRGVKPLLRGRVLPAVAVTKMGFDAVVGGWYYFNTRRWEEKR